MTVYAITNVSHVKLYKIYSDSKLNLSTDNRARLAVQNNVILTQPRSTALKYMQLLITE